MNSQKFFCPVCEKNVATFLNFGYFDRPNAQCPSCQALERHRFVWLYFKMQTNLFKGSSKRMLHVAPEKCFKEKLRSFFHQGYVDVDLTMRTVSRRFNLMEIRFESESFDIFFCSHVLQEIQDDLLALEEIFRILKPGGWAVFIVPIDKAQSITYEIPFTITPRQRQAANQDYYVRVYGNDFFKRLEAVGFTAKKVSVLDLITPSDAGRMGLSGPVDDIFYCTKG